MSEVKTNIIPGSKELMSTFYFANSQTREVITEGPANS